MSIYTHFGDSKILEWLELIGKDYTEGLQQNISNVMYGISSALFVTCGKNKMTSLPYLIDSVDNICSLKEDESKKSLLHIAAEKGCEESFKLLLEKENSIDMWEGSCSSVPAHAVRAENIYAIKYLINNNAKKGNLAYLL